MIPLKPILKIEKHLTHKHQIESGIEYNLLKDLYRSRGLGINKIFKTTNMLELYQIEKILKQSKISAGNQSLFFIQNEIDNASFEKYLMNKMKFNEIIKMIDGNLKFSRYPKDHVRNYVVKSSHTGPSLKDQFQFTKGLHYFTLIYLIE